MTRSAAIAVIITAAVAASILRLPFLSVRPVHTDEAVHAVKFGELLEDNAYRYDPYEYHGPTLNYFTLIPAWVRGQVAFEQLDAVTLRLVPAVFSLLLVLMPILLIKPLGPGVAALASVLTALSPAFAFYGVYYIQETLLVAFTFMAVAAGYHYCRSQRPVYAVLTGGALGLAFATKETFLIVLACMIGAAALWVLVCKRSGGWSMLQGFGSHVVAGIGAFVVVAVVFFSSFFTNPEGIVDSVRTYGIYFARGGGHDTMHVHPWYYYLSLLTAFRLGDGPIWSEAFVLVLAVVGMVAALRKRLPGDASSGLFCFVGFYAILLAVAYSVIPYKTPWCLLGFHHGFILLAGLGGWYLLSLCRGEMRVAVAVVLAAGVLHLGFQAWMSNGEYASSTENPYVYAQTTEDVPEAAKELELFAKAYQEDEQLAVEVVFPGGDYWPWPWYLRGFDKVGYYSGVDFSVEAAPVVIASTEVRGALMRKLYELPPPGQKHLYVPLTEDELLLRPAVPFEIYVRKDVYDRAMLSDEIPVGEQE
ncbi:putative membrane protein [Anaerohalosphaera lusitana]|uniref:Putative membrane protein n=1 Tax=Anaerohalosphaera lusitana TaxID=1936003 RepID=A0A1U9NMZ1_9BACT|nr:flippase activity-associated protein Agl23 [Anaerohalosphaera lusitana]AQT69269.1 putative membrane protein [Anaerohalosphaera lusitana]